MSLYFIGLFKMGSIFHILTPATSPQGWEAGAGRSWLFLAHWSRSWSRLRKKQEPFFGPFEPEPEQLEKKYQKPELLEKKSGAGAAKKISRLSPCEN